LKLFFCILLLCIKLSEAITQPSLNILYLLLYYMPTNPTELFFQASENGNFDELQTLIQAGIDVNTQDEYGKTALIWVTRKGHSACIPLLIEAGADVNVRDKNGWTALMYAAFHGRSKFISLLIELGADVKARDDNGWFALIYAAMYGNSDCISLLIEAGCDLNARDTYGNTVLVFAIWNNNMVCIRILIESGADIHSLKNIHLNNIIKNNIYTVDVLKNTTFNRRKNALLFYKIRCLN